MRLRLLIALVLVAALTAVATVVVLVFAFHASLQWNLVPGPRALKADLFSQSKHPSLTARVSVIVAIVGLIAVIVVTALLATRRVLDPVRRLAGAAERLSAGELSVRVVEHGRDELGQLVATFNAMSAALEEKVSELELMESQARRFAGDVSHELRTPLTTMTAVADILDDPNADDADTAAAARLVSQEIRHLNRLVEDLVEISRFDAKTAQLVLDDVDVGTAVQRCVNARGWTDAVGLDVPTGLVAVLDRRRFDAILANLLANAFRHGRPPITVTASTSLSGSDETWVAVAVRDHGTGVPATSLSRVFDRFYKVDQARARSEGSGLGLAIAAENARLHGGSLEAANHPDGGALFTLWLPAPLMHASTDRTTGPGAVIVT